VGLDEPGTELIGKGCGDLAFGVQTSGRREGR
jgi:hypothetical protein